MRSCPLSPQPSALLPRCCAPTTDIDGYVGLWHPAGVICLSGQPIVRGHEALRSWMGGLLAKMPPDYSVSWDMTYHVDPQVYEPLLVQAQGIQTIHAGGKTMESFGNITLVKDQEGGRWKLLTVAGVGLGLEHVGNLVGKAA